MASMKVLGIVLICVLCNVVSQLLLKLGTTTEANPLQWSTSHLGQWWSVLTAWPTLGAIALWTLSTIVWIYLLSNTELSFAYALYGLNYVLTPLLGSLYFKETMSPLQIIGVALITLGVGMTVAGKASA